MLALNSLHPTTTPENIRAVMFIKKILLLEEMDIKSLIVKLHPLERAVLPALKTETELGAIAKRAKLQEIETMRALQWLENKQVLKIHALAEKYISVGKNGARYGREGLPEKAFLQACSDEFKGLNVITKKSRLTREEVNACIGLLKRQGALETEVGEALQVRITSRGKALLQQETPLEAFLKRPFPIPEAMLAPDEKKTVKELLRRREFLKIEEKKKVTVELTLFGQELLSIDLRGEVINRLTASMLRTGSWKEKQFRAYDIEINVPHRFGGRKHFITQAIEYARQIWLEMGFQEMAGNMVQTSFWNFDALFTAQDHPVREMQDTYFLGGEAEKGKLPSPELVRKIREVHETGGKTDSTGWQYQWDEEEAKKNVLRTHTTVLTAKKLSSFKKKDLPAKFFALGKNFRNEAVDWKHLNEFNQTEGIVVDKNATFCHLLGYLRQFFGKMGFPDARFRPAFFPYTSPSVEIDVFHPVKKEWVEFGGAGLLRPEVVVPLLGEDIPVLAWGPGFDRTIMEYWNIVDMRDLYKNDVQQLREMKMWLR